MEPKTRKKLKVEVKTDQVVQPKLYSFDQWAARRDVPSHHKGGMKAFVRFPNKSRTLEEWDLLFLDY